jgi:hypothetical protein
MRIIRFPVFSEVRILMAATKNETAFSFPSGGTVNGTATAINIASDYTQQAFVRIVQVGTATTAATFTIQASPGGVTPTYYNWQTYTAPMAAGQYDWVIDVPVGSQSVQIVYTAQVGGTSSTISAELGQLTGL